MLEVSEVLAARDALVPERLGVAAVVVAAVVVRVVVANCSEVPERQEALAPLALLVQPEQQQLGQMH